MAPPRLELLRRGKCSAHVQSDALPLRHEAQTFEVSKITKYIVKVCTKQQYSDVTKAIFLAIYPEIFPTDSISFPGIFHLSFDFFWNFSWNFFLESFLQKSNSRRFCTGKCVKFSYIYIKNAICNSLRGIFGGYYSTNYVGQESSCKSAC